MANSDTRYKTKQLIVLMKEETWKEVVSQCHVIVGCADVNTSLAHSLSQASKGPLLTTS